MPTATKVPKPPPALNHSITAGPIYSRIGPIFDPAWLKLVDERILGEIITVQLDAAIEQLDLEKRAVVKIKEIVNKARR